MYTARLCFTLKTHLNGIIQKSMKMYVYLNDFTKKLNGNVKCAWASVSFYDHLKVCIYIEKTYRIELNRSQERAFSFGYE